MNDIFISAKIWQLLVLIGWYLLLLFVDSQKPPFHCTHLKIKLN